MSPSDPSREPGLERRETGRRLLEAVWRGDLSEVAAALDLDPGPAAGAHHAPLRPFP